MNLPSKIANHLRFRARQVEHRWLNASASRHWRGRVKLISAMVRIKNEEEFLAPSILSIAHLVDEIVIVDNGSTDRTPQIIKELKAKLGSKLQCCEYKYQVTRVGEEYHALYRNHPASPSLLHNYYNWCLAKCTMPFVMKWDGDMIALDELTEPLDRFKRGGLLQFDFGGHNLSPDRQHVLTWAAGIEPRIYPRQRMGFEYGTYGGENLQSWVSPANIMMIEEPVYAHMKYCKQDPASNQSPEFRQKLESKIKIAGPLPAAAGSVVSRWLA